MADAHYKRTLIHQCDVAAPQTSRSGGEVQVTYGTASTLRCRYVPYSERWASEGQSRQIERQHHLMMMPDAEIGVRYQVSNIKIASSGASIDAGPFLVTEVLKLGDGQGLHHIEAELERSD